MNPIRAAGIYTSGGAAESGSPDRVGTAGLEEPDHGSTPRKFGFIVDAAIGTAARALGFEVIEIDQKKRRKFVVTIDPSIKCTPARSFCHDFNRDRKSKNFIARANPRLLFSIR